MANASERSPGRRARRVAWSSVLVGAAVGFYLWQPQRIQFFPRPYPKDHPWIEPDPERLFSPTARVTLVTAHPDDSEFYLGGLLTRLARAGARLSLIVATDGDKRYQPFQDAAANRRVRRQEQDAASAAWRAEEVIYLGYSDGRLPPVSGLEPVLAAELRRLRPDYILAFDAEYPPRVTHRDHLRMGEAATRAVERAAAGDWLLRFSTSAPDYAVDVTADWDRRWELLFLHRSQFSGWRRPVARCIITRSAEADGRFLRVRYAEGLRCLRLRRS